MTRLAEFIKRVPKGATLEVYTATVSEPGHISPNWCDVYLVAAPHKVLPELPENHSFWAWTFLTEAYDRACQEEGEAEGYEPESRDFLNFSTGEMSGDAWNLIATPREGDAFTVEEMLSYLQQWALFRHGREDLTFTYSENYRMEEDPAWSSLFAAAQQETYEIGDGLRVSSSTFDQLMAMDEATQKEVMKALKSLAEEVLDEGDEA